MTDSFKDYINSFSNSRYEEWLEDRATDNQRDRALMIRTPLSEQELEIYEKEQEYIRPQSTTREIEVYDNRDVRLPQVEYLPRTNRKGIEIVRPQKYKSEKFKVLTLEKQILQKRPSIQLPYTRVRVQREKVTFFQRLKRIFTVRRGKK